MVISERIKHDGVSVNKLCSAGIVALGLAVGLQGSSPEKTKTVGGISYEYGTPDLSLPDIAINSNRSLQYDPEKLNEFMKTQEFGPLDLPETPTDGYIFNGTMSFLTMNANRSRSVTFSYFSDETKDLIILDIRRDSVSVKGESRVVGKEDEPKIILVNGREVALVTGAFDTENNWRKTEQADLEWRRPSGRNGDFSDTYRLSSLDGNVTALVEMAEQMDYFR